jgi:hypothetical protein
VNYYCTRLPASFCVVAEADHNQLVFFRLDPTAEPPAAGFARSQLHELARTGYNPSDWGISPDGSSAAMVRPDDDQGRVHIVPLAGTAPPYDVTVKGWTNLYTLNWAVDGKGWYISNRTLRNPTTFLYVDLAGNATALNAPESFIPSWGIPSPDGAHLAFSSAPGTANAWLLENF